MRATPFQLLLNAEMDRLQRLATARLPLQHSFAGFTPVIYQRTLRARKSRSLAPRGIFARLFSRA